MDEASIFLEALQKPAPADRAAYLDGACAGNATLRRNVEMLLEADAKAGDFLNKTPANVGPTIDQSPADRPGTVIGPYKLLQQIGEGGMGVVWMAEQTQPVQRKVALKVIKPGMDSRQVIARFEAERQALAMMDHVNIARVLDAGTTESGLPYFVMELVHGVPITKYCDDSHLTPRERLELFVPVCQAIQHAHQKGIIHRDIKPSNVMVTLYDGKPVPKVIDFGVAKATEHRLTERTLFTQYGTMVGTLEYMSPEQAEMSALGVDTRSDIFSLGVLFYELLTGSTPLTQKRVKEAAYGEILRMIREEEPPKPSTRLSDSGEALASISAQRHTEPAKLSKLMRGELDWIVMKTLEKDRNRRYETANGLGADVQRYLADEPVQACPPSRTYRVKKFVRRHWATVAVAGSFAGILIGAALVSSVLALNALRAKDRAIRAENSALDNTYAADMGLAMVALDQFDVTRARELLNKHIPTPGDTDRRGLEWRYLAALARGEWTAIIPTSLDGGVSAIAITKDDRFIVAAGAKGQLCVIRFENFKTVFSTRAFASGGCSAINVARDGRLIAVSGDGSNQSVGLWRLDDEGKLSLIRQIHAVSPYAIAISPDTQTLAVGTQADFWSGDLSVGGITKLFDIASGKELARLPESGGVAVAFSPDGKRLATGHWHGQDVKLWDPATRKVVQTLAIRAPGTLQFSADSKLLLIGNMFGELKLADLGMPAGAPMRDETFTANERLAKNYGYIRQAAMSDDQRWEAMCCENVIYLGDRLAQKSRQLIGHESRAARCLAFSHQSDFLVSGDAAGTLMLWNVAGTDNRHTRLRQSFAAGHGSLPDPPSSPDGRKIAFRTGNHETMVWDEVKVVDTASGEVRPILHTPAWPLAFIDDNTLLTIRGLGFLETANRVKPVWAATNANPALEFWDLISLTNRQLVLEAVAKREVSAVAVSPDCRLIALAWRRGERTNGVILFALATGEPEWSVSDIRSRINGIAFSPDGQSLALACFDGKVQILRVDSGAKGPEMLCQGVAECPAFSPDGKTMAVACWDGIRLFSMPDGKTTSLLNSTAHRAKFSADGKTLVTDGGHIEHWWHLPTGRQLFSTTWPWAIVPESMIALNGETFAAGCFSSRVGVHDEWDVFQLPPLDGAEQWLRSQPSSLTEARRLTHRLPEPLAEAQEAVRLAPNEFAAHQLLLDMLTRKGDKKQTLAILRGNVAAMPDSGMAHHHLAVALERQGRNDEAIAEFQKTIRLRPDWESPHLCIAKVYDILGQDDTAASEYTKAIELKPDGWEAWSGRAFIYFSRQQWDKAVADFSKAIDLAPQVHTNWWHRGHSYLQLAQWDKAAADFGKVVDHWPDAAEGWYWRGAAFAQLNQPDKAVADLQQAIAKGFNNAEQLKTDPKLDPLRTRDDFGTLLGELELDEKSQGKQSVEVKLSFSRATASSQANRNEDAVAEFTKVIELKPDLAAAWAGRGDSFRKMNEFAKMAEDYSEAIKLKPDTQWYWHERAYADLMLGDHKKAIADNSKAIELGDQDAGQRLRRGYSYQALGELQHAKDDYSKAIELNPKYWKNWQARAQIDAKLGQSDQARDDLDNAIKLCSNNAGDQNGLAWELAADPASQLHNPKAAVELSEKAVGADPLAGEIWNTLGVARYRAGTWQGAVTALNKSMELRHGGDSSDWFFLAMGHWQLNEKEDARTWYDKAVAWMDKNEPKNEELLRFRREAEELLNVKK